MDAQSIYTAIVQAVGSLGFPIVAYFMMARQNEKLEQRHEDESKLFSKAIENNTIALEKLIQKIEEKE